MGAAGRIQNVRHEVAGGNCLETTPYARGQNGKPDQIPECENSGVGQLLRHCVAKATFNYLDNSIFWIVWKWAKRRHQNRGASWIRKRYYTTLGLRKWCFYSKVKAGKQESRILLTLAQRTKIERHVKVRSEASPYDPDFKEYFIKRKGEKMRKKNDSWVI